jgi:hypothetical protein
LGKAINQSVTADQLESGEKGYYMIGHKSYRCIGSFLLRTGYQHVEIIFDRLKSHG